MKRFLFVCGCARSGTSALVRLLDSHRHVAIGMERYIARFVSGEALTPELFEEKRFFTVEKGDTFYKSLEFRKPLYNALRKKWQSSLVVGDKIPKLYTHYERVFENFPAAQVVFMSRNLIDVANSYKKRAEDPADKTWPEKRGVVAAIEDWNSANALTLAAMQRFPGKIHVISHESLFLERKGIKELFDFVGVKPGKSVQRHFEKSQSKSATVGARRSEGLSVAEKLAICTKADTESFRKLFEATAVPPSTAQRIPKKAAGAGDAPRVKKAGKARPIGDSPSVTAAAAPGT